MTEPAASPGSRLKKRRWWKYLLIAGGAGLLLLLAALWYVTTDSFQAYVRGKMVAELERISGGRAEIGSFHIVPFHTQVEVRDITLHGNESRTDVPLFHADHLYAHMKVISFLRAEFGFHSLTLDHPVLHIAIAADGTTNIPGRAMLIPPSSIPSVEQLFALSIDHLIVKDGELLWADQKIPLDFNVHDTALQMDYSFLRGIYEGHLTLGKVDTTFADYRPFAWTTSIDFDLGTTSADVHSLQWSSGRSHLEASGRIGNFANLHIDANYNAHFDLQEVAAIARRRDLRAGVADFKGNGHWSAGEMREAGETGQEEFAASGALMLRDLGWQDDQIAIAKANATSDYSVTDEQIKLSKLQGKLFSGSFSGDAQVDNWLRSIAPVPPGKMKKGEEEMAVVTAGRPPLKKGEKPKLPGVETGGVHLRLRDFSAGEIATALSVPAHPLGHFHPAGVVAGSVDATWKGSPRDGEIGFALNVDPPQRTAPGELPMTAHMQGKYRAADDTLELAQFDLSTPESRIQARGLLSQSSSLHLSIATSNLEEWRPLVTALGGPANLPFRIDGNAAFNGVAGGAFSAPTLAGTLVAQDFEFTVPATSHTPETQVHWDALAASIQFSSHELALRGGTLQRGETSADFEASALLQNGQFTASSPYTARVNLHNVDVASTAALAGFDAPVSGTADVSLQIAGTRANPRVQGHIHATDASAYGEAIEKFDADLQIANGETALNNIQLTHQDAAVSGSAAYTVATRGFRLDLAGKNFDLSRVKQIQVQDLPAEGRADFTLLGSGTIDDPLLKGAIHVTDLTLDQERSGGLDVQFATKDGQLQLTGSSDFTRGKMALDGTIGMHGDFPASVTVHLDHVDLDPLWFTYLGHQLTGHSSVSGTVLMQVPLRFPEQFVLHGDLSDVAVEVEYAKLHNVGPVHTTITTKSLEFDSTHLVGEGTNVVGHGSILFTDDDPLDLTADGQVDLKLLSTINPDLTGSGAMSVHMEVKGTWHEPIPQGNIQVKNGAVNYAGLPSGLSEMNGSLTFTRDRIHIEQLSARTGGGSLDFKGDATSYNRQLNFNLTAVGKDVRLRYPPGVSSTANAELHWIGNRSSSTVSGNIMVTKLAVTPGFDFGSYLARSQQTAGITAANSPLYGVKLDVAVHTAPELQMKTAVARLSGDADLKLRGSVGRPSVLGRADILEGDATFNGIKFRLERGDITFANPVAIEPQLNLQATTHVRNYDLDVTVTGTPERLAVNYRSEPPLPKSDIIALLALGRTNEESQQLQEQSGQVPFTDVASNLIINQAINDTVSSRLQKLFGVSRIKIDPQGLTTETNPTARGPQITIEQQFANNISLTYSTNVSQSSQQIIEGEYFFTRNISAVGTRDQNGVVSFDVRIRRRKK
ncbi:MAG TPA: translocation/assembly module TamB domain-containing protein [Terriglobales bacterium]|nr:translocation/assembly module TamB domain-containing protein [Terriglobales bacterium]